MRSDPMSRYLIALPFIICSPWLASGQQSKPLTISWEKNYLTIRGDFPGGELRTLYLEAYCRPDRPIASGATR